MVQRGKMQGPAPMSGQSLVSMHLLACAKQHRLSLPFCVMLVTIKTSLCLFRFEFGWFVHSRLKVVQGFGEMLLDSYINVHFTVPVIGSAQ